jgi:hypothetical protein
MYILLALFFVSLFALVIMLLRQVSLIRSGIIVVHPVGYHPLEPDLLRAKYRAKRSMKRYGYILLVAIFRLYFRAENALKIWVKETKNKIGAFIARKTAHTNFTGIKKSQPSGFLQNVAEYKTKLRHLRHKIKEEEENK